MGKDELNILLKSTEKDYIQAKQYNSEVMSLITEKDSDYSEPYTDILKSLQKFAEATEYYILIMQNIVYMAETEQEFANFAEPFLNFALMSQNAMEECVTKINLLIVDK